MTSIPLEKLASIYELNINQTFFSLLDELPSFVYLLAPDFSIPFANRSFRQIFGDPEHKKCYEVIKKLDRPCPNCPSLDTLISRKPLHWEESTVNNRVFDIYERFFADEMNSPYVLKVGMDITDRKRAEAEIARLDRLNLLAEMAAGIAHEIRNPITTVKGFIQILSSKNEFQQYQHYYDLMLNELDRANSIITEFLSLARNQTKDMHFQNLNTIVQALTPLIRADAMRSDITVLEDLGEIEEVKVNEKEIRQLILNLTRNAIEAMDSGKSVTIRTFMDSDHVVLAIQDEGKGIPPEILEKLGIPFLTTKEAGTGLGLPTCYGIVNRHNAKMEIDTSPQGTTFYVRFKRE